MKAIISFLWFFLANLNLISSQNDFDFQHPATDVYGFEAVLIEKIVSAKCDCCCEIYPKSKKCTMYKIKMERIFMHRDTTVFKDSTKLKEVCYLVVSDRVSNKELALDHRFVFTAYNSCSNKILVANQFLRDIPNPVPKNENHAFVTGLGTCKKLNLFQRIFLAFGIKSEKIYRKAKDLPPEHSKFVKIIEHTE